MQHTEKTRALVALSTIAYRVMEDNNIPDRYYMNIIDWLRRGYTKLSQFDNQFYEQKKLAMSDLSTITIPADCIQIVALGIPYGGRFWIFNRDGEFVTTTTTNTDTEAEELDSDQGEGESISNPSYRHLGDHGGKNQYRFSWVDKNTIYVNGLPSVTVTLRYISSGINAEGDTEVPLMCEETLIHFAERMYFKRIKDRSSMQIADSDFKKAREELRWAQAPSVHELFNAVYESFTQTIKR